MNTAPSCLRELLVALRLISSAAALCHGQLACWATACPERRKTERELELARQKMQDVVESTTAAREARDEAHHMMAAMQAEQDRQAKAYDRALAQMQTIVEKDRNMMEIERQRQLAVAGEPQTKRAALSFLHFHTAPLLV